MFAPTADEIADADEAIEIYRASEADGVGAIGRDGRLVDAAHMRLAGTIAAPARRWPSGDATGPRVTER